MCQRWQLEKSLLLAFAVARVGSSDVSRLSQLVMDIEPLAEDIGALNLSEFTEFALAIHGSRSSPGG